MSTATLRASADFERVLRAGRRARRGGLTVYVARGQRDAGTPSRLGLVVRGGRAVDRNLVKRRLRAAWRNFSAPAGFDVAIRATAPAVGEYQDLEDDLFAALTAAGLPRSTR